uniref:Chitin-binding type-2 domain-containing protein n=1 Tax=Stomoxys calcitrans TaxID=35570 RepID=A0A1I8P6F0_STOCA
MKADFILCCAILALSLNSALAATCSNIPSYTTELQLACVGSELEFFWPNYANVSTYYFCQGPANPKLASCEPATFFSYVFQKCYPCSSYIPSQACETLKTQNPPVCVPIDGSGTNPTGGPTESTEPTPIYPNTTTKSTTVTTTKTPTTTKTTTLTTETTGTAGTTSTAFPPPPSPSTANPDIPVPPTAAPTPPSIENNPPIQVIP